MYSTHIRANEVNKNTNIVSKGISGVPRCRYLSFYVPWRCRLGKIDGCWLSSKPRISCPNLRLWSTCQSDSVRRTRSLYILPLGRCTLPDRCRCCNRIHFYGRTEISTDKDMCITRDVPVRSTAVHSLYRGSAVSMAGAVQGA